jgi:ADP-dependent phosphofructokinase/glucokinase
MTPKEKAKELVDKYKFYLGNEEENIKEAVDLALIAVYEILKEYWSHDTKRRDWWQEVKQEMEKL